MKDQSDYNVQNEENSAQVSALMSQLFPNLSVPHEDIYKLLLYLDQTQVNPQILPRVVRSVQNIILGTGQGEVLIHVRGEVVTLEARERDEQIKSKQVDTTV